MRNLGGDVGRRSWGRGGSILTGETVDGDGNDQVEGCGEDLQGDEARDKVSEGFFISAM